ncbi:MAG: hypothetical protein ACP5MB_11800, partial [bacterium]
CHVITNYKFKGSFKEFESIDAITFCNNSPDDFSNALNRLIQNIEDIKNKKEINHKVAYENYDIRVIVKKLYESIIGVYEKLNCS